MDITTIQIEGSLKEKLDKLKIHHRETYNELLLRMVGLCSPKNFDRDSLIETIDTLSDPTEMREIAQALEEYGHGEKGITLSELKRELKL